MPRSTASRACPLAGALGRAVLPRCAARPARRSERRNCAARSTLLLDNYDSYTYNLFHLVAEASGGAFGECWSERRPSAAKAGHV